MLEGAVSGHRACASSVTTTTPMTTQPFTGTTMYPKTTADPTSTPTPTTAPPPDFCNVALDCINPFVVGYAVYENVNDCQLYCLELDGVGSMSILELGCMNYSLTLSTGNTKVLLLGITFFLSGILIRFNLSLDILFEGVAIFLPKFGTLLPFLTVFD